MTDEYTGSILHTVVVGRQAAWCDMARQLRRGHAGSMAPVDLKTLDPAGLGRALEQVGYLPDDGLSTAAFLALRMHRPLFLEGDAGVGKTSLAHALAEVTGAELVRLQCYEGIDASQALYDWDFPRQVLHLRAAETTGALAGRAREDGATGYPGTEELERSLYDRRFLIARPILRALEHTPSVLLIDEIDRADDEFEAFLLEVLADNAVSIPELGTIRAQTPPLVVLTSNRTREVHDALKRRCLYHWVAHPSYEREVAILRRRLPEVGERLAREVASAVRRMREADLLKPPGVAESIDWAQALHLLGADSLDADRASATLGAVLKYQEDAARIRDTVLSELAG
jgi:MoxR-like ATPase